MSQIKKSLLIFLFVNAFLYIYIWKFNSLVPFNRFLYSGSAHHYYQDERVSGGSFSLPRALGVWDSQWYLRIADRGYPYRPSSPSLNDKTTMDSGLNYAFSPLYPLLLVALNLIFRNLEQTAFILSLVLLGVNFYSLYYVIGKLYSAKIACRATILLFLFPFSLFYRSYYAESLFLSLFVWYSFFLIKRKWLPVSFLQGLMPVVRPTGLFILPLTIIIMVKDLLQKKFNPGKLMLYLPLLSVFLSLWMIFNFRMTGDILYWKNIMSQWISFRSFIDIILYNISLIKSFFILPFHTMHFSQVDIMTFFIFGWLVYFSLSYLKPELWWLSFILWIAPLFVRDTISYSRFQIVSFPLFIYLASLLKGRYFAVFASVLFALLLYLSLYFVNWYWFG